MSKIGLITTCAPFVGEKKFIQELAFYSWSLQDNIDVVVLGNDYGVKQICERFNFIHHPDVRTARDLGINNPAILLNDGFQRVLSTLSDVSSFLWLNSDLILVTSDIFSIIPNLTEKQDFSGGVGLRRDYDNWNYLQEIDSLPLIFEQVVQTFEKESKLHGFHGIDLFFWSYDLFKYLSREIPPFIANGWRTDHYFNYFLFKNAKNRYDVSEVANIVHLTHKTSIQETKEWQQSHEHNKLLFPYGKDLSFPAPKKVYKDGK